MSATLAAAPRTRTDLRRASRVLAAVVLPVGPAAVAVLRYILPYTMSDTPAAAVREVAAHQSRQSVVVWLGFLACLTLVPGVIYAGRVVGRTAPRLAAVGTILLVLGYVSLAWINVGDAYLLFGVRHHLSNSVLEAMYSGVVHPAAGLATGLFVAGHVGGTILLGLGMLRGRVVAPWAGWATLLAQPIHFLAAVVLGSHLLDLIGWGLNTAGFAALAIVVLRLPDDAWAPAPGKTNVR
jgi:hypothetical protein